MRVGRGSGAAPLWRSTALVSLAMCGALALSGCGRRAAPPPPPVDDTQYRGGRAEAPAGVRDVQGRRAEAQRSPQSFAGQPRTGMSSREKLVILGGAAALYYLYRRHQHAAGEVGAQGQYYLSKNGRVYYRDAEHRAHWVTPPAGGIAVPAEEAAAYEGFQGYQNRPTGRDLSDLGAADSREPY